MELELQLNQTEETPYDSFVGTWQLDPAKEFCDELIDFFENNTHIPKDKISNSDKDDTEMCIYHTTNECIELFTQEILIKCYREYCEKYSFCAAREVCSSIFKIQKYDLNESYKAWHCERNNLDPMNISRHLVWMMYLNDVSDQGETEFFYQKLKIKPKAGKVLIWPCDWTHTHRGVASPTQEKYIITGWFQHRILHPINFNAT